MKQTVLFGGERRKMPWDEDNSSRNAWGRNRSEDNFREYEPNKAYTGRQNLGEQEYRQMGSRWQNSNPVASQFRAESKAKDN